MTIKKFKGKQIEMTYEQFKSMVDYYIRNVDRRKKENKK